MCRDRFRGGVLAVYAERRTVSSQGALGPGMGDEGYHERSVAEEDHREVVEECLEESVGECRQEIVGEHHQQKVGGRCEWTVVVQHSVLPMAEDSGQLLEEL